MPDDDDIGALNALIREQSPQALAMLEKLPSPCVVDDDGQSPLNVAIESGNASVTEHLLDINEALEFAPAVHAADQVRLIKTIYNSEGIDDIDEAERRILKSVGCAPYWQRTPLLQACRYQNRDAIHALIARGAKLTAKDLVGETPLSLCVRSGGADLAAHFIESCAAAGKKFSLTEDVLSELCRSRSLYELAIEHGRASVSAKRFIFNMACATLDRDTVTRMLDDGYDVNAATTHVANPVSEVLTAQLAWLYEAEGWQAYAAGYAHANGHPATTSISVPSNPGPGDMTFGQIKAHHAELNKALRRTEVNPKFMTAEQRQERLALLDLLLDRGLDKAKVEKNLNFPLISDVLTSNEPEFIAALSKARFRLGPEQGYAGLEITNAIRHGCFDMVGALEQCGHRYKKSIAVSEDELKAYQAWRATHDAEKIDVAAEAKQPPQEEENPFTWELYGESTLEARLDPNPPRASEPCTVRLVHSNVYGPRAEVRFAVRVANDAASKQADSGWQELDLIRETVFTDDGEVDLASLDEPPYGETPWDGLFELTTTLPKGRQTIEIRITAPETAMCGILEDWTVDVGE